jgi:GNAT superfamily N-acetyltransferase
VLYRTRNLFMRQQTSVINAIRAHLAEFGVVAPVGRRGVEELLCVVGDISDRRLPGLTRTVRYVEWGRLSEIGDLYVLSEHRRKGLARRLIAVRKAVRRSQSPSRQQVSGDIASANSTLGSASRSPVE